jgi:hypothetical protein
VTFPRRALLLVAGCLLVGGLPVPAAQAETGREARAAAHRAAARVEALQAPTRRALAAYREALGGLAVGVSRGVSADARADAAARRAGDRRRQSHRRVRALYMSGGPAALYASVLGARSPADALRRLGYVQRVVRLDRSAATSSARDADDLRRTADALDAGLAGRVVTAGAVRERYEELVALLDAAAAELARLGARARSLAEAEQAAARVAALRGEVEAGAAARVARARATAVPGAFRALYTGAARTCPGLSWTVLAAIGQVESGHGRNTATSYAGAQGPMQFLPSTFAAYAVDGDRDGRADIASPADSVYTAARYLCANGAGRDEASLRRAVWHYNHAEWYVQLVLRLAGQLAGQGRPADG